ILPFYAHLLGLAAATLLCDLALHLGNLVWIGRYLGIPGVILILASFGHSLRKRGLIRSRNPTRLLRLHEWLAWLGATLVLVHAGIHFNAVLAWLATFAMALNIVSGLTGKYLVLRAQRWLKAARGALDAQGLSAAEIEQQLFWDSLVAAGVRKWRAIHIPISVTFAVLAGAHIVAVFLFWGWK
ncbi:MAG: hypothetical protein KGL54_07290, partial [Sphingomonadales bacterium]|nr:hypothetical protein [Sphingomonadales bacterium]